MGFVQVIKTVGFSYLFGGGGLWPFSFCTLFVLIIQNKCLVQMMQQSLDMQTWIRLTILGYPSKRLQHFWFGHFGSLRTLRALPGIIPQSPLCCSLPAMASPCLQISCHWPPAQRDKSFTNLLLELIHLQKNQVLSSQRSVDLVNIVLVYI